MVRRAFSFIELVVSIVVIGIVFMSVPLILTETGRSAEAAIQQEAVMAGVTQLVNVMSYQWDENQTDETLNGGYAKVLDTYNGATALQCIDINGSRWRIGHFREPDRRRCYNAPRFASTLEADGDLDDVDDIILNNASLLTDANETNATEDYKKEYSVTLDVVYVSDDFNYTQQTLTGLIPITSVGTAASSSTNIKMVSTTITSPQGEKVVLRSFLTNIGEYKIYHKNVQ
jgi:prepilin-type N-terminal cleavage/methylation domain-containing protein